MGRRASREGRARPGGSDLAPCAAFYCCLCYCLWNVWVCVMTRMAMSIVPSSFLWHAGSPILPSSCSWPAGSAIGYVMCCCQLLQKMAANVMTLCLAWKLKKWYSSFALCMKLLWYFKWRECMLHEYFLACSLRIYMTRIKRKAVWCIYVSQHLESFLPHSSLISLTHAQIMRNYHFVNIENEH
jgi:hypothetical protein